MGLFGKSIAEKLIDHATPLLKDENNFEVYFKQFNGNKLVDKKELAIFKDHWKAILTAIILDIYVRLGSEKNIMSTKDFAFIRMQIMGELVYCDAYDFVDLYMGKEDWDTILSKHCFKGQLSKEVREDVKQTIGETYLFFEKSCEQFL